MDPQRAAVTFADIYDQVVGADFWDSWWPAFERLKRDHDLHFKTVCDVACGTGETLQRLAAQGHAGCGCDLSADMIRVARAKCAEYPVSLWVADMAAFTVPQPVDLVLCCYDALNMLPSEAALGQTFSRFHAALKPGGHVICDLATRRHLAEDWGSGEIQAEVGHLDTVWHTVWNRRAATCTVHLTVTVPDEEGGGVRLVTHRVVERAFSQTAIEAAIEAAGLTVVTVRDLPSWAPGSDDGGRLVYLLRRPAETVSSP